MSGVCLFAALAVFAVVSCASALAASGKQPAPPGTVADAPPQYTRFTSAELTRGFMALAFGSDLTIGDRPKGIHRYGHPIRARVIPGGSVARTQAMQNILADYARSVPKLALSVVASDAPADIEIRLIDEKNFRAALQETFGAKIARAFVARTNPQCMSSVKSDADGEIVHSLSFVIVDQGEDVFRDCAYHELLHAFGLPNHDQRNPWTMLNQTRMVGYLSVYDRALLTLLYDPRLRPGMNRRQAGAALPGAIEDLGLAGAGRRTP